MNTPSKQDGNTYGCNNKKNKPKNDAFVKDALPFNSDEDWDEQFEAQHEYDYYLQQQKNSFNILEAQLKLLKIALNERSKNRKETYRWLLDHGPDIVSRYKQHVRHRYTIDGIKATEYLRRNEEND